MLAALIHLFIIYQPDTFVASGIGRGVAVASLSNGASVVIASSNEAKVNAAVELLKKNIENTGGAQTVTGQAFDMRDSPALTKFLSGNGPFDHLVCTFSQLVSSAGILPNLYRSLRLGIQHL